MAINFPSTPSDQDTYTEGGITWRYIASKTAWLNSISGSVYVHTHVEADITDIATAAVHTNTTQIATTAFVLAEISNIERDTRTGTSETLTLADAGQFITLNNASPITLTIPANGSVAFPVGTRIDFAQLGAGQVTFAITTDTLRSSGSMLKLTGQYSGATIYKLASTEWILIGDIAT